MKGTGLAYLAYRGVPTPVSSAPGPAFPQVRPPIETDDSPAREKGASFFSFWSQVRTQALRRGSRVG